MCAYMYREMYMCTSTYTHSLKIYITTEEERKQKELEMNKD